MPKLQSAAIPYRKVADEPLEVLLVTSRKRGRWVLPKGKVKRGMLPHRSAALEAFEEAGVVGDVDGTPIGCYIQKKANYNAQATIIEVQAFPLRVTKEYQIWPEKSFRRRAWMPLEQAIEAIADPAIKCTLRAFASAIDRRPL